MSDMHTKPPGRYRRLQEREAPIPQGEEIERLTVNFPKADGDRLRQHALGPPRRNMSDIYRVALSRELDRLDREKAKRS